VVSSWGDPLSDDRHGLTMPIRISETARVLTVPYGASALANTDGSPDDRFVDLKANPGWAGVIPPSIGWPETAELLRAVNAPDVPFMTLAADQGVTAVDHEGLKAALVSFVVVCFSEVQRNRKPALNEVAAGVKTRLDDLLSTASDELQRSLDLSVVLELTPTIFRDRQVTGWSLSILMAAYGQDEGDARLIWRIGMMALQQALCPPVPRDDRFMQ
jgi:hypothetical protein